MLMLIRGGKLGVVNPYRGNHRITPLQVLLACSVQI